MKKIFVLLMMISLMACSSGSGGAKPNRLNGKFVAEKTTPAFKPKWVVSPKNVEFQYPKYKLFLSSPQIAGSEAIALKKSFDTTLENVSDYLGVDVNSTYEKKASFKTMPKKKKMKKGGKRPTVKNEMRHNVRKESSNLVSSLELLDKYIEEGYIHGQTGFKVKVYALYGIKNDILKKLSKKAGKNKTTIKINTGEVKEENTNDEELLRVLDQTNDDQVLDANLLKEKLKYRLMSLLDLWRKGEDYKSASEIIYENKRNVNTESFYNSLLMSQKSRLSFFYEVLSPYSEKEFNFVDFKENKAEYIWKIKFQNSGTKEFIFIEKSGNIILNNIR